MNDEKELMYWFTVDLATTITRQALERGMRPSAILDAFNRGLENGTAIYRQEKDKAESGQ